MRSDWPGGGEARIACKDDRDRCATDEKRVEPRVRQSGAVRRDDADQRGGWPEREPARASHDGIFGCEGAQRTDTEFPSSRGQQVERRHRVPSQNQQARDEAQDPYRTHNGSPPCPLASV